MTELETAHAFVIRVECSRMALGMDATSTYHAFIYHLPEAFRAELEGVCKARRASGQTFEWKHVVELARDTELGASLVKGTPISVKEASEVPRITVRQERENRS